MPVKPCLTRRVAGVSSRQSGERNTFDGTDKLALLPFFKKELVRIPHHVDIKQPVEFNEYVQQVIGHLRRVNGTQILKEPTP